MEEDVLRTLIREKLADGRLPQNPMPPVWSAVGDDQTCGACGLSIKSRFVMARIEGSDATQLHVRCFYYWEVERTPPRRWARDYGLR